MEKIIYMTISSHTLGDNCAAENQRYVDAVKLELNKRYPGTNVTVELAYDKTARLRCFSEGLHVKNLKEIANRIWDLADY